MVSAFCRAKELRWSDTTTHLLTLQRHHCFLELLYFVGVARRHGCLSRGKLRLLGLPAHSRPNRYVCDVVCIGVPWKSGHVYTHARR